MEERAIDVRALGRVVRLLREKLDIDQKTLAERARVSEAYISRLERGLVPSPKLEDITNVARALQVTPEQLVEAATASGYSTTRERFEELIRRHGLRAALTGALVTDEDAEMVREMLEHLARIRQQRGTDGSSE